MAAWLGSGEGHLPGLLYKGSPHMKLVERREDEGSMGKRERVF